MINTIKNYLKKRRRNKLFKRIAPYTNLSKLTRYGDSFGVELRSPENREYLSVGDKGIIDARFVFEKETGKITIGNRCMIAGTIISINEVNIGDDVIVAWDTLIYDHNSHSTKWSERREDTYNEYDNFVKYGDPTANKNWSTVKSAKITICDKAWIGTGCKILKGVTIGEGAIVQAGSVVVKDIEPWSIVGGNPAQFIKWNDEK